MTKAILDNLEDLFLEAAEGNGQATEKLHTQLKELTPSSATRQRLTTQSEILFEDPEGILQSDQGCHVLLELTRLNVATTPLRDTLARFCRKQFGHYPDPAGLIRAMGLHDSNLSGCDIHARWHKFTCLEEGAWVWHDSYGLGKVTEADGFSDLFVVQFAQKQSFSLAASLTALSFVRPGSTAFMLLSTPSEAKPPTVANQQFIDDIAESFAPPLEQPWGAVEAILVPTFILTKNFSNWKNKGELGMSTSKETDKRTWEQSRSLEELLLLLKDEEELTPSPDTVTNLGRILKFTSSRANFMEVLTKSLAVLKDKAGDVAWLDELLEYLPEDTLIWSDYSEFSKLSSSLPAKLRAAWFGVSLQARGTKWFITAVCHLPLKFWKDAVATLGVDSEDANQLEQEVNDMVRRGDSTADAAVWLWNLPKKRGRSAFSNPHALFRILGQQVSGDHIKARKDLLSLLMDNKDFQAALMRGGSEEGIQAFVRAIKTTSLLEKGEQQSLLVKIVRIFPVARSIVEEKSEVIEETPLPKITSYRSLKMRHDELQEIINKKIPENSAAISHARSYGDLRENAEYKAAKDEQKYLMSRRAELERDLKEISGTDFSEVVVTDRAIPGSTVTLDFNGTTEIYHLLGMWDSDPDRHIISYDTSLGRILVGKQIDQMIKLPDGRDAQIINVQDIPDDLKEWVKLPD